MPSKGWYVNGLDELLEDSIDRMKDFNSQYMRDMRSVFTVEKVFQGIDMNEYSISDLKKMALDTIHKKNLLDPTHSGKLPILCKDKKVRYYNPDQWSETIARTRSRALQEKGLHNEMAEAGFDLVIVSIGGSGDMCKHWEGKILSISGKTPGYQTVAEAQRIHLFHPNCVHSTSPVIITEDEAGPRIWGRDDLPKAAREDLRRAMDLTKVFKLELQMTDVQHFAAGSTPKEKMVTPWLSKSDSEKLISKEDAAELLSKDDFEYSTMTKKQQRMAEALDRWTIGDYGAVRKAEEQLYLTGKMPVDKVIAGDIDSLNALIEQAPKYRGYISRGTYTGLNLKVGETYSLRATASFSAPMNMPITLFKRKTKLVVKESTRGVSISKRSGLPGQKEVLVPKGNYAIDEIIKEGDQTIYILSEI